MTMSLARRRTLPGFGRIWTDAPAFTATTMLVVIGLIPLCAALALDDRMFQGEQVWIKPIKFHVAMAIYLISLGFFARYMPAATRSRRPWRWFASAVCFAVIAEMVWIGGAASINAASHFNTDIPFLAAVYSLMGVFAVLLTSGSLVMGISVWRNTATGLPAPLHLSIALGLVLTFVLTVGVAGYMSSTGSRFVGVSTREMALMGWSRDAGDLRVAHFLATHALHALPLVGLVANRGVVLVAGAVYAALVAGTFWQALLGQPFLPMLG